MPQRKLRTTQFQVHGEDFFIFLIFPKVHDIYLATLLKFHLWCHRQNVYPLTVTNIHTDEPTNPFQREIENVKRLCMASPIDDFDLPQQQPYYLSGLVR